MESRMESRMEPPPDEDRELEAWLDRRPPRPGARRGLQRPGDATPAGAAPAPGLGSARPGLGCGIGVGLLALQTLGGGMPARPALMALMLGLAGMTALGALWVYVEREEG